MSSASSWFLLATLTFLGSGLGGACRHFLSEFITVRKPGEFPAAILLVNLTGAFLIGLVASVPGWGSQGEVGEWIRVFVIFGFLGGYTTVSSFSLQTWHLLEQGRTRLALAYVVLSVAGCLLAATAGMFLVST